MCPSRAHTQHPLPPRPPRSPRHTASLPPCKQSSSPPSPPPSPTHPPVSSRSFCGQHSSAGRACSSCPSSVTTSSSSPWGEPAAAATALPPLPGAGPAGAPASTDVTACARKRESGGVWGGGGKAANASSRHTHPWCEAMRARRRVGGGSSGGRSGGARGQPPRAPPARAAPPHAKPPCWHTLTSTVPRCQCLTLRLAPPASPPAAPAAAGPTTGTHTAAPTWYALAPPCCRPCGTVMGGWAPPGCRRVCAPAGELRCELAPSWGGERSLLHPLRRGKGAGRPWTSGARDRCADSRSHERTQRANGALGGAPSPDHAGAGRGGGRTLDGGSDGGVRKRRRASAIAHAQQRRPPARSTRSRVDRSRAPHYQHLREENTHMRTPSCIQAEGVVPLVPCAPTRRGAVGGRRRVTALTCCVSAPQSHQNVASTNPLEPHIWAGSAGRRAGRGVACTPDQPTQRRPARMGRQR